MVFRNYAAGLVLAVAALCACSKGGGGDMAAKPLVLPGTAPELMKMAVDCAHKDDLPCAEASLVAYEKLRPADEHAEATLGYVYNREGKDKEAIVEYEKVIASGIGAYDVFAGYADSLGKVGRTEDAINWSYKTLKLLPSLVDVRGNLAKMLVQTHRRHEALALLTEFDQHREMAGHGAYFTAQRLAIESLPDDTSNAEGEVTRLRLVKLDRTWYAPVSLGEAKTEAFVVDTGATSVVVDDMFLAESKVPYRVTRGQVAIRLADGNSTIAREVMIDHLKVGAFDLDNVRALTCRDCQLLLGDNVLSRFEINSGTVQGVDTMTLSRRDAPVHGKS